MSEENQNPLYLYWTPKLRKLPYKHWFITGSSKCTTKELSCLLIKLQSTIKDGLVRYCNTKTSYNAFNNMWILKNSQGCCHHLSNLMSVLLCLSGHLILQHFTTHPNINCGNPNLVILYTKLSERKTGMHDIIISNFDIINFPFLSRNIPSDMSQHIHMQNAACFTMILGIATIALIIDFCDKAR